MWTIYIIQTKAHVVAIIFVLPKISSINVNFTSKKIKNKNKIILKIIIITIKKYN